MRRDGCLPLKLRRVLNEKVTCKIALLLSSVWRSCHWCSTCATKALFTCTSCNLRRFHRRFSTENKSDRFKSTNNPFRASGSFGGLTAWHYDITPHKHTRTLVPVSVINLQPRSGPHYYLNNLWQSTYGDCETSFTTLTTCASAPTYERRGRRQISFHLFAIQIQAPNGINIDM